MKSFSAGFLDADTAIEAEGDWSNTVRIKELLESSTIKLNGGSPELRQRGTLESERTMDSWKNSLMVNPVMLTTDMILEPISTFVEFADPNKKNAAYEGLKELLRGSFEKVANEEAAEEMKKQKHEQAMAEVQRQRAAAAEQARLHAEEIAARQERDRKEAAYREEKRKQEQEEKERIERERKEREKAEKEANTREDTVNNNPTPKSGGSICFPPSSIVTLKRDGVEVDLQLNQVKVGDVVLTYDHARSRPVYTRVLLWADANVDTPTKYFRLELEDGSEIKLTGEHLILVGGSHRAVMARDVNIGDVLYKKNVGFVKVKSIGQAVENGFCAPITASGTIFVDGVLASCYAYLSDISLPGGVSLSAQVQGKICFLPLMIYRGLSRSGGEKKEKLDFEGLHPYVTSAFRLFGPLIKY